MVRMRSLLVEELFLLQGFAHPSLIEDSKAWPFRHNLEDISEGQARKMLGNTMHLSCVGVAVLYLLSTPQKKLEPCL